MRRPGSALESKLYKNKFVNNEQVVALNLRRYAKRIDASEKVDPNNTKSIN